MGIPCTLRVLAIAYFAMTLTGCDQADRPAPLVSGGSAATAPSSSLPISATAPPTETAGTAAAVATPATSATSGQGMPPIGMLKRPHPDQIVVKRDETLYEVSRRYDVPLRALIDANHLQPPYKLI